MPFSAFYHVSEAKQQNLSPQKKKRKKPVVGIPVGNNKADNESSLYVRKRMRDRKAAM